MREGIILGNYYINNNGYKINLSENKVESASNSKISNASGYAINMIGNEYIRTSSLSSSGGAYTTQTDDILYVNPYYLATINNVTPFTKTSDHTLKITYTITEVE